MLLCAEQRRSTPRLGSTTNPTCLRSAPCSFKTAKSGDSHHISHFPAVPRKTPPLAGIHPLKLFLPRPPPPKRPGAGSRALPSSYLLVQHTPRSHEPHQPPSPAFPPKSQNPP